jgi:hypothetical protein
MLAGPAQRREKTIVLLQRSHRKEANEAERDKDVMTLCAAQAAFFEVSRDAAVTCEHGNKRVY